jgi:hypothetical protein
VEPDGASDIFMCKARCLQFFEAMNRAQWASTEAVEKPVEKCRQDPISRGKSWQL